MIVLDTNVVSELVRPQADAAVVAWLDQHPVDDVYLTRNTKDFAHTGVVVVDPWTATG